MIWAILLLGFVLRIISLNQSLWLDEAINVLATQKFSLWGMITEYAKADFHPPGYFIFLWIWTRFFGVGEIFVRLPSVIFGIITIYIVYLIGQKIYSKGLGLISALFLAVNPLHIYYSQEARMYALATLSVSINFFLLTKILKKEKVNLAFLILSNLLILLSDYVAYFTFPAQLVFLLIFIRQKEITKKWFLGLFIAVLLGIWWLPIFLQQLQIGLVASSNLPTWRFVVGGFDFKNTPLTFIKFVIGRISLSNKLIYYSLVLPVCLIFLHLLLKGVQFLKSTTRNLLVFWLALPIILGTLVSLIIPVYNYFRVLFILPAFIILISLGIVSYTSKIRYILLGIILLIQLFSSSVYLLNSSYHREDWRGVVNYLKSSSSNSQIYFESSGVLSPFYYYGKNNLSAKGALKNFPAKNEDDLVDLSAGVKGIQDIFLVDYLVDISDPDRLVKKKLNELGFRISEIKDFNGVGFVYHYAK